MAKSYSLTKVMCEHDVLLCHLGILLTFYQCVPTDCTLRASNGPILVANGP